MADKSKSKKKKAAKAGSNERTKMLVTKVTETFAAHGVVIMFLVAGAMIGLALMRARSYLNPVRDESRYTDGSSHNNYSKIDYKIVNKLQDSLIQTPINIGQSLAPNRSNPFSE